MVNGSYTYVVPLGNVVWEEFLREITPQLLKTTLNVIDLYQSQHDLMLNTTPSMAPPSPRKSQ